MNVRPNCIHQFLLAHHPSGVGDEQDQDTQCFRPEFDGFAIRPAQLGPVPIQFKTGKTQHHALQWPQKPSDAAAKSEVRCGSRS
jgi:hypothetical protein